MIRFLGVIFMGLGLVLFGIDLMPVLTEGSDFYGTALGEWWAWAHRDSLLLLQPAIERYVSPVLWDPVILTVLEGPAFAESALLGLALWLLGGLGRRKARR